MVGCEGKGVVEEDEEEEEEENACSGTDVRAEGRAEVLQGVAATACDCPREGGGAVGLRDVAGGHRASEACGAEDDDVVGALVGGGGGGGGSRGGGGGGGAVFFGEASGKCARKEGAREEKADVYGEEDEGVEKEGGHSGDGG